MVPTTEAHVYHHFERAALTSLTLWDPPFQLCLLCCVYEDLRVFSDASHKTIKYINTFHHVSVNLTPVWSLSYAQKIFKRMTNALHCLMSLWHSPTCIYHYGCRYPSANSPGSRLNIKTAQIWGFPLYDGNSYTDKTFLYWIGTYVTSNKDSDSPVSIVPWTIFSNTHIAAI